MIFLLLAFLWPAQPAIGQLPEMTPEARFQSAAGAWLRHDDGAAITHLLLLAGRHPSHPLAPWAHLGAALLYDHKGDFIAAIVQYRKAEPLFIEPVQSRLRGHREELELELARIPVQIMRLGRRLLAGAAPTGDWIRLATWFSIRFRATPLSARLKMKLASIRLLQGRRFEALFLVIWASHTPSPTTRSTAASVLRAWRPAAPAWAGWLWLPLIIAGAWSLIRLWQLGPMGPAHGLLVAVLGGALTLLLPRSFVFFPCFFFLAGLTLWCYGFPRRLGALQVASLAIVVLWYTACSLLVAGRFPL